MLALVLGCGQYHPWEPGSDVWKMFPFDGEREWVYASTDPSVPYALRASCDGVPELVDGENVYTVAYDEACDDGSCDDGARRFALRWSSDAIDGVYLHGFAVGEDPITALDPPVWVTDDVPDEGHPIETVSRGVTYGSTLVGTEECPVALDVSWPQCGRWHLTVDVGDGYPIAGDWWAVAGNGVAGFQLATDGGQWRLTDFDCHPRNSCDGQW
jgi:hypothetical protein